MTRRDRAAEVVRRLARAWPEAHCELVFGSDFELLVATILSAQCTDARVNVVTRALFRKYRRPEDYYAVPPEELQGDIRPTGFFRNKAKSIQGAARAVVERYGRRVPVAMDDLLTLPGVARKTAHCVRGNAHGLPALMVDTHVTRLAQRLGLTRHDDPVKIERDLAALLPEAEWTAFSHRLIWHGRRTCQARKPRCEVCPLAEVCPSAGTFLRARAAGARKP